MISGKESSRAGAKGLFQFLDATAKDFNINPLDPAQAIEGAAQYMRALLNMFDNDVVKAVAAYNGGEGNLSKRGLAGMKPETKGYVLKVLGVRI